jgi:hypothetical protein
MKSWTSALISRGINHSGKDISLGNFLSDRDVESSVKDSWNPPLLSSTDSWKNQRHAGEKPARTDLLLLPQSTREP